MKIFKFLLCSKTIEIFRGYLRAIFFENELNFINHSTTICIYKEKFDKLSHYIKDLILLVLKDEIENIKNNDLKENIEIIEFFLEDIFLDNFISNKVKVLALESLLNNKFEDLINNCEEKKNRFIIFELPEFFREFISFVDKYDYEDNEEYEDYEDYKEMLNNKDEINKKNKHIGIFNATTEDASNMLEESIYRVFCRFIERINMQENKYNIHFILLCPFFKPPKYMIGEGKIEICLPIEWEFDKYTLSKVIIEIFEGFKINNDIIEIIISSISNRDEILSNLMDICFEIKNSIINKYIGQRLLKKEKIDLLDTIELKTNDVIEFIYEFNRKKLNSNCSIDNIISSKISIDDDFIGLVEIRNSIKESIRSLEININDIDFSDNESEIKKINYPITWFLFGGTGSGKSTLVRSIVSLSPKVRVIFINIIEIISPLQGITNKNLRKIFNNALNSRPCILVFDDIEYLLGIKSINNEFETETRSKIYQELTSTLLYLLDSVVFNKMENQENNMIDIPDIFNEKIDFINSNVYRKVYGIMILMTSKINIYNFPKELINKIQKYSLLQFPKIEELLNYYINSNNEKVINSAQEIVNELNQIDNKRILNASEFKLLVQENIYKKYGKL